MKAQNRFCLMVASVVLREPDCPGYAAQVAADQGDRRGCHGDIRAGADGHAHVRLGQGRGVVDPIADHRDDLLAGLEAA